MDRGGRPPFAGGRGVRGDASRRRSRVDSRAWRPLMAPLLYPVLEGMETGLIRLPAELRLEVRDALVAGTTFAELVYNTRGLRAEEQAGALRRWLRWKSSAREHCEGFEGAWEELGFVVNHVQGKCTGRWNAG